MILCVYQISLFLADGWRIEISDKILVDNPTCLYVKQLLACLEITIVRFFFGSDPAYPSGVLRDLESGAAYFPSMQSRCPATAALQPFATDSRPYIYDQRDEAIQITPHGVIYCPPIVQPTPPPSYYETVSMPPPPSYSSCAESIGLDQNSQNVHQPKWFKVKRMDAIWFLDSSVQDFSLFIYFNRVEVGIGKCFSNANHDCSLRSRWLNLFETASIKELIV